MIRVNTGLIQLSPKIHVIHFSRSLFSAPLKSLANRASTTGCLCARSQRWNKIQPTSGSLNIKFVSIEVAPRRRPVREEESYRSSHQEQGQVTDLVIKEVLNKWAPSNNLRPTGVSSEFRLGRANEAFWTLETESRCRRRTSTRKSSTLSSNEAASTIALPRVS